jgi:hypothetical protein
MGRIVANQIYQPASSVPEIRHRTTAARYRAHARDKRRGKSFNLTARTLAQLERLFRYRYGRHLPDDDAGRDDLSIALNYVAGLDAKIAWAADRAPWLAHDDAIALAEEITAAPKWLKARALGERLGVTDRERTKLRLTTIRPIDVTDEALAERARQKDRERKARERQQGRQSRPQPLNKSRPWEAEGINRATWYRRRKRATKSVRPNTSLLIPDEKSRTEIAVTTPADAGTITPSKSIRIVVDGAAVGGNPDSMRRLKTRFPTAMRLNTEQLAYAQAAGFTPPQITTAFELFRDHNLAGRNYSADWGADWFAWIDRRVDIINEQIDRQRRQAYFERRAA